jgi:hypothetical protein
MVAGPLPVSQISAVPGVTVKVRGVAVAMPPGQSWVPNRSNGRW